MREILISTPKKDIAETAMIVSALRILLRNEYNLVNTSAIDQAFGILEKHGLLDEGGNLNIPQELWVLINADIKQVTL